MSRRLMFTRQTKQDLDNHYVVGAGVGAKNASVRQALKRRANNAQKEGKNGQKVWGPCIGICPPRPRPLTPAQQRALKAVAALKQLYDATTEASVKAIRLPTGVTISGMGTAVFPMTTLSAGAVAPGGAAGTGGWQLTPGHEAFMGVNSAVGLGQLGGGSVYVSGTSCSSTQSSQCPFPGVCAVSVGRPLVAEAAPATFEGTSIKFRADSRIVRTGPAGLQSCLTGLRTTTVFFHDATF